MAFNPHRSDAAANAANDAMASLLNNGWLRIYDSTGTGQPATGNTGITTQVLLAELRFAATAFAPSVGGVAVANAIQDDLSANNTGLATWFRTFKSDGTTAVYDGSVDLVSGDLVLSNTSILVAADVAVSSLTLTATE